MLDWRVRGLERLSLGVLYMCVDEASFMVVAAFLQSLPLLLGASF